MILTRERLCYFRAGLQAEDENGCFCEILLSWYLYSFSGRAIRTCCFVCFNLCAYYMQPASVPHQGTHVLCGLDASDTSLCGAFEDVRLEVLSCLFQRLFKEWGGFESHSKELLTWCNKYIWTVYALFVLLGCISCCVLLLSSSWSVCVHQDCTSIYCSQKQSGTKLLHTSAFEVAVI